jgi:threonine dehydrogenase-like Zn-dependent dehydrogenase
MLAAVHTQGEGFAVREIPAPQEAGEGLLLRVGASAICGTDLRIARGGHRKLSPGQAVVLGHEFAGTVEAVAPEWEAKFAPGTRVGVAPNIGCGGCEQCRAGRTNMCPDYAALGINLNGGHAARVRVPPTCLRQGSVFALPEEVSFVEAALVEPLSCVVNSLRACRLKSCERVLVVGAGPMGLLHLLLARERGAAWIGMADIDARKLDRASGSGADWVFDGAPEAIGSALASATDGRGVDVVVTACPAPEAQERAIEWLAPFGRVCLFGGLPLGAPRVCMDTNLIPYRNLVVTGVTGGCPLDFEEALGLVTTGRIRVTDVVSHRMPAARMSDAFETALEGHAAKVVLEHE